MIQSKQTLRDSIYTKLKQLTTDAQDSHSSKVRDNLLDLDYIRQARTICVYQASGGELGLHPFISTCRMHKKTIGLPRIESTSMDFRIFHRNTRLEPHSVLDFLQPPAESPFIRKDEIDILIVPMVAFDSQLNRLGRGGGYYDRFLANIPDNTRIIGVAHSIQQVPMVTTELHDIPMDIIVTERDVLTSAT